MAQLPPRAPTNWPPAFQKMPPLTSSSSSPWVVDDFLDFASSRRVSHRRSMSDSIAFLDPPLIPNPSFDRLDDDQLMSMFSDDLSAAAPSLPSSPSDHNSHNDEKPLDFSASPTTTAKVEQGEVESFYEDDHPNPSSDSSLDPKRVKRILANRQSAQRSRVRKLQYISELERSVTTLQTEVSALSPRVAFLDHQRLILNVDNSAIKQRIAALAQDKIFKDAHQEALKKEIERLRQIYQQQNMKGNNSAGAMVIEAGENTPFPDQKKQLMAA